jgi:hypothetical protein
MKKMMSIDQNNIVHIAVSGYGGSVKKVMNGKQL